MSKQTQETNRRVLVIDDNPAIHDDFRKILGGGSARNAALDQTEALLFDASLPSTEPQKFEIDAASQGKEGLEMVQRALEAGRPYALAFVDVRMPPGWDGVETITHLWQAYPELQVVICTAYSDYSWEEMTKNVRNTDSLVILKKPFDNIEVLQLTHALTKKWLLNEQAKCKFDDLDKMVSQRTQELQLANENLKKEIAERTQAEEALTHSEERFSKAFSASPIPMGIVGMKDERYVDVNESFLQMAGFSREEVIHHTPSELNLWGDLDARAQMFKQLQQKKPVRNLQCQIRTKSGELRESLVSAEVFNLGGEPHILVIRQDISERLRLEGQLRQAQKMEAVGQLAAGVAHDFNNILTVIQGHVSLRLRTQNLDRKIEESLKQVSMAAERASMLTRQLLAFSRKQIMQLTVLNLHEVVGQLGNMLRRLIGENIDFRSDCPEGVPPVYADACNIEQVIINLAVNARDAMPQGGSLTIRTSAEQIDEDYVSRNPESRVGDFVCLSVTDTGCGMDATTLRRIFEPFFTTKEVGKGTGMGLATVYGIVKQHNGWVEVTSKVGQGSTFKIFLPLSLQTQETPDAKLTSPEVLGGNNTILVTEDEKELRELVRDVLEGYGYRILEASNGVEALDVWQKQRDKIDLLLTDVVMPGGMSGPQLAETLRARDGKLRVIYTSAYDRELIGKDCELQEGYNYLPKPYHALKLAQTVRFCLDH